MAIGPTSCPAKTAPSLSACCWEATASMNSPTRQLPSAMSGGVSARTATVRLLTSTPSTAPASMWKASTTRHRSESAGIVSPEVVHGHTMSQEQFSKYVPSSRQAIATPLEVRDDHCPPAPRRRSTVKQENRYLPRQRSETPAPGCRDGDLTGGFQRPGGKLLLPAIIRHRIGSPGCILP